MKLSNRSTVAAALMLALIVACALCGCANLSPVRKVAIAQQSYAATLDLLTDLRTAGKISDADAVKIEAVLKVVDNAFAVARAKAVAGDRAGAEDALAVAVKSLGGLNQWLRGHRLPEVPPGR